MSSRVCNDFRAVLVAHTDISSALQSSTMCMRRQTATNTLCLTTQIAGKVSGEPVPVEVIYHLDYRVWHFTYLCSNFHNRVNQGDDLHKTHPEASNDLSHSTVHSKQGGSNCPTVTTFVKWCSTKSTINF